MPIECRGVKAVSAERRKVTFVDPSDPDVRYKVEMESSPYRDGGGHYTVWEEYNSQWLGMWDRYAYPLVRDKFLKAGGSEQITDTGVYVVAS